MGSRFGAGSAAPSQPGKQPELPIRPFPHVAGLLYVRVKVAGYVLELAPYSFNTTEREFHSTL